MEENEFDWKKPDLGWRPSFSIVVGVGWLIFIILWLAFYASNYAWEKNVAIFLLSILAVFILLGGIWALWGIRQIPKEGKDMFKILGFKWRVQISIIIPFAAMIFLIVWFWYYAVPYTVWQNLAVLIVTLIAMGGILGLIWARWGIKNAWKFDKQTAYYHHKCEEKEEPEEKED